MPSFSYTATDLAGSPLQGEVDAVDMDAAKEALRAKDMIPVHIEESPSGIPILENTETSPPQKIYLPIAATLRLYAGWLLAYYSIVYAIGWYAHSRNLPMDIPYVEALLLSPLVLSFTLAAFLFLMFHTLHQVWGKGIVKGMLLSVAGIGMFVVYRMNVM
jgi:type II secretory pathway component PulF